MFSILNGFLQGKAKSLFVSTNSSVIELNKWYHISFVLENTTGYLYLDGKQVASSSVKSNNDLPENNTLLCNFIAESDSDTDIILDEITIFQGALKPEEINIEFNPGKFLFNFFFIYYVKFFN